MMLLIIAQITLSVIILLEHTSAFVTMDIQETGLCVVSNKCSFYEILGPFHTSNFGRIESNAIQTMDNEMTNLIIYCLKCIQCDQSSTYETGLSVLEIPKTLLKLFFFKMCIVYFR
jgi:hypothetical protein